MRVFLLEVIDPHKLEAWAIANGLYYGMYADNNGYVVVAENETSARKLASVHCSDREQWWLEPSVTSCVEVDCSKPHVVMANEPTG